MANLQWQLQGVGCYCPAFWCNSLKEGEKWHICKSKCLLEREWWWGWVGVIVQVLKHLASSGVCPDSHENRKINVYILRFKPRWGFLGRAFSQLLYHQLSLVRTSYLQSNLLNGFSSVLIQMKQTDTKHHNMVPLIAISLLLVWQLLAVPSAVIKSEKNDQNVFKFSGKQNAFFVHQHQNMLSLQIIKSQV